MVREGGAGQREVWEDEGRVAVALPHVAVAAQQLRVDRHAGRLLKAQLEGLNPRRPTDGYCPPVRALRQTFLLISAPQTGQPRVPQGSERGGSWRGVKGS